MKLSRLCGTLLIILALAQVEPATAQSPALRRTSEQKAQPVALCDPARIDSTFSFADPAAREQTVSLHFQNKGTTPCLLRGELLPSFAVDGHSMIVDRCWLCDADGKPSPAPAAQPANEILLVPAGRAAVDLSWTSHGGGCRRADWVDFSSNWAGRGSYLVVPYVLYLTVCSPVKSSGYHVEPDALRDDDMLRVFIPVQPVYSDERARLHIEFTQKAAAFAHSRGCPELYTVRDGDRLDPLPSVELTQFIALTSEEKNSRTTTPRPAWMASMRRKCETDGDATSADVEIKAPDLASVTEVEWRADTAVPGQSVFLSKAVHFTVEDVNTLPPNWGEATQGIQAGISIDHSVFHLGDRVPVHLRWNNVGASSQLAQGECRDPWPVIEIQDAQHHPLEAITTFSNCLGHGVGPFTIATGKPEHGFVELPTQQYSGTLPMEEYLPPGTPALLPGPGVYYFVAVWTPNIFVVHKDDGPSPPDSGIKIYDADAVGGPYAAARSQSVRIEFLAQDDARQLNATPPAR